MSVTRECDLADAVTAKIASLWSPSAPDAVQRVWVADFSTDPDYPDTLLKGQQVYVVPVTMALPEWVTRAERKNQYTFAVIVASRYTGDAPAPPNAFTDAVVAWGEQYVLDVFCDPGLALSGGSITYAFPPPEGPLPEVAVLVDRELFLETKTVVCQYTIVLQDQTTFAGANT